MYELMTVYQNFGKKIHFSATDFLEKWKKFQDEKGQRRVSLATKPSSQDGNE